MFRRRIRLPWVVSIVLFLFTILGILLIPKQQYSCSTYNDVCTVSYKNKILTPPISDYTFKKSDIAQYKIVSEKSCFYKRNKPHSCRDVYKINVYLKSGKVVHLNKTFFDYQEIQNFYNKLTNSDEFVVDDSMFSPLF